MSFAARDLLAVLQSAPPASRYVVAFSGGCDSTALLHALSTLHSDSLGRDVLALHVDHGWHPDSKQWARHCVATAQEWGVPCTALTLSQRDLAGESREAAARSSRYALLYEQLRPGDMLLTAHHRDDQAETLLLQLFRGSGPKGLAAMPQWSSLGDDRWHGRPLLNVSRESLRRYAGHYDLLWVEDPSNFDTDLDRNYLRREVWPAVSHHWPGLSATLARAASLQAECADVLADVAASDLPPMMASSTTLSVSRLNALSVARRRNVLRHWLAVCGLPTPSRAQLRAIETDVLPAAWDATPMVSWPGACVRRYRDELHALAEGAEHDAMWQEPWAMYMPLSLPSGLGSLQVDHVHGRGLSTMICRTEPITVRFRRGGERCRPVGARHARELKTLFQEWGVPPWQRDHIPLLFIGRELACVVGYCYCEPFAAKADEPGLDVVWLRDDVDEKSAADP